MDEMEVGLALGRLHNTYKSMREEGDNDMRTVIHYLEKTIDELREL